MTQQPDSQDSGQQGLEEQGSAQYAQQSVLAWLKDAHAMEEGAVPTLTAHAAAAKNYPEVQAKLEAHLLESRRHADLIEGCIERLGGRRSVLKEAVGTAIGRVAGIANLPAHDTVVKNALGDYAAEHFEIASYKSLIAAAEVAGDTETAAVCQQILGDEEEMAAWLEGQIPEITRMYLLETPEDTGSELLAGVKETVGNLGEKGKEIAGNLGEKGKEIAGNVDPKNALLASGALLAGAGAALLIGQALLGGSKTDDAASDATGDTDASAYDMPAYDSGMVSESLVTEDFVTEDLTTGDLVTEDLATLDMLAPVSDQLDDLDDLALLSETPLLDEAETVMLVDVESVDMGIANLGSVDAMDSMDAGVGEAPDDDLSTGVDGEADMDTETESLPEIMSQPGPYSGFGPMGYEDAGDPLSQEIASRLTQHGQVDASKIEITIDGDEVLLEGFVDSEATKRLAQEAVESVEGVERVQNLVQVQEAE